MRVCSDSLEFLTRNSHRGAGDSRRRNPRKTTWHTLPSSALYRNERFTEVSRRNRLSKPIACRLRRLAINREKCALSALTLSPLRKLRGERKEEQRKSEKEEQKEEQRLT